MSLYDKIYYYFILTIIFFLSLFLMISFVIPFNKENNKIRGPRDIFSHSKTYIESHCGVNREIFQNTLPAFSKAIEYKIDSLETDVWLTKDNVLVLVHGQGYYGYLKKYYGIRQNITKLTYKTISKHRTVNDSLRMPTLSETMKLTKNKIFLNLEIKDPRVDLVFPYIVKLIEEYDFFDQISLSSFHHDYYNKTIEYNRIFNKNLVFGFIYPKNESNYDYTKRGSSINIYYANITREICDTAHSNGMSVLAWFAIRDEENERIYKELLDNKVDVICCNEPLRATKYRDYYYKKKKNKFLTLMY